MEMEIAIIVISIVFSAFFSGMEIAFVSANKLHIELEKKRAGFISKILNKITQKTSKFITTMLVGNNISLVIYSYYMGQVLVKLLPENYLNEFSSLLVQTIISTLIILVTAEFLPKAIFRISSNVEPEFTCGLSFTPSNAPAFFGLFICQLLTLQDVLQNFWLLFPWLYSIPQCLQCLGLSYLFIFIIVFDMFKINISRLYASSREMLKNALRRF